MKLLRYFFVKTLSLLNRILVRYTKWAERLFPGINNIWDDWRETLTNDKKLSIVHNLNGKQIPFSFYTPNPLARYRAQTFSTKEPETLEWIDKYAPEGGVLFDIGANVGLYSIYHAVTKGGRTYSFEPSVFNLKLLVKNINLNNCHDKIRIISNPLTSVNSFADFNLQSTVESGALSSFGVDYGQDGKKLNIQTSYSTLGFSLDFLVENKILEDIPASIKIDVDGIEHLILKGATKVLANPLCRSVLIEVDDSFLEQASKVNALLTDAGFTLLEKSSALAASESGNITYNQIWVKQ
jgi:FkbM family methyltransferase